MAKVLAVFVTVSMSALATPLVITSLVAVAVTGRVAHAQRPERQQEVRLPNSGIILKAGWQLLIYDGCRFAVPESWRPNAHATFMLAPDGSSLSIGRLRITDWSVHKAQVRAAFGQVKMVHEDSDRRLWFEIGDTRRTQHYIEVANGLSTCTGVLDIGTTMTPDAGDTTTRIADSIGPAPDKWP